MNEPLYAKEPQNELLTRVKEGMKVYDRDGKEIGMVEDLFIGSTSERPEGRGKGAATESASGFPEPGRTDEVLPNFAFGGGVNPTEKGEPEVIRNRMLREGFIKVDSRGIFSSDRYALPDQIASVSVNSVHLKVHADDLIEP